MIPLVSLVVVLGVLAWERSGHREGRLSAAEAQSFFRGAGLIVTLGLLAAAIAVSVPGLQEGSMPGGALALGVGAAVLGWGLLRWWGRWALGARVSGWLACFVSLALMANPAAWLLVVLAPLVLGFRRFDRAPVSQPVRQRSAPPIGG